ncbi:hypothetical protein [Actinophytocola sp.]
MMFSTTATTSPVSTPDGFFNNFARKYTSARCLASSRSFFSTG